MMKKINFVIIFGILLVVLGSFAASAGFGVGFGNRIGLYPGQSVQTGFSIQNVIEPTEDLVIEVTVEQGTQYIYLEDGGSEFNVPSDQIVPVRALVSIPQNARPGDIYTVTTLFRTISGGTQEGGTVDIAFGMRKSFEIEVLAPEGQENAQSSLGANVILWIIIIVLLVLIIWLISKTSKKKR